MRSYKVRQLAQLAVASAADVVEEGTERDVAWAVLFDKLSDVVRSSRLITVSLLLEAETTKTLSSKCLQIEINE